MQTFSFIPFPSCISGNSSSVYGKNHFMTSNILEIITKLLLQGILGLNLTSSVSFSYFVIEVYINVANFIINCFHEGFFFFILKELEPQIHAFIVKDCHIKSLMIGGGVLRPVEQVDVIIQSGGQWR